RPLSSSPAMPLTRSASCAGVTCGLPSNPCTCGSATTVAARCNPIDLAPSELSLRASAKMAFAYGLAVVMRSAIAFLLSELRRELVEQLAVRLGVDFAFQDALGTGDSEAHDLAPQLVARAIALELDLRLGRGQRLLTFETGGRVSCVADLVGTRLRLRFDRDGAGTGFLDHGFSAAAGLRQVLLALFGGGETGGAVFFSPLLSRAGVCSHNILHI